MKLDKAIEIATNYSNEFHPCTDFDYVQAIRLLIEAGKRHQDAKGHIKDILGIPLPGETPENYHPNNEATLKKLRESPLGGKPKDTDKCPFKRLRAYPGCYEDCPDTTKCPLGRDKKG